MIYILIGLFWMEQILLQIVVFLETRQIKIVIVIKNSHRKFENCIKAWELVFV